MKLSTNFVRIGCHRPTSNEEWSYRDDGPSFFPPDEYVAFHTTEYALTHYHRHPFWASLHLTVVLSAIRNIRPQVPAHPLELALLYPFRPKWRSKSFRAWRSPSSLKATDFALDLGSEMYPLA